MVLIMYAILGCGSIGMNVTRALVKRGENVLIIDKDQKWVASLKEQGFNAIVSEISTIDTNLLKNVKASLILTSDNEKNLKAVEQIRNNLAEIYIIVRTSDQSIQKKMVEKGANIVIQTSDRISFAIVREVEELETKEDAFALLDVIKNADTMGIFLHNNPDPDALASALAFKKICDDNSIKSRIYYGGKIDHQENRAFVNLLKMDLFQISEKEVNNILDELTTIALLDTAKPSENNILPSNVNPNIVIDHHLTSKLLNIDFCGIDGNVGATSTMLTKYLQKLGIEINSQLAAALLYGVRTDTKSFTRNTSPSDLKIAAYLLSIADHELLSKFESPPLTKETTDIMGKAIQKREIYAPYLLSCVGIIKERDALPQAADFLLRLEGVSTVLIFGIVGDSIVISARSNDLRINLGEVLQKAFGEKNAGGHAAIAGAQIPLGVLGETDDKDTLVTLAKSAVRNQFFTAMGIKEKEEENNNY